MDGGGGAFGAGKAGGQFDLMSFVKKPTVIIRAVSVLFAIIVFGCISSEGYDEDVCVYNKQAGACGYGIFTGVIAFLGLLIFLALDAVFETHISSVQQRKMIVMADMGFCGIMTFLWFVCACYLSDTYRKADPPGQNVSASSVEAAIAFAWFSIGCFAALTYFAVQRYRAGIAEDFSSGPADQSGGAAPAGGQYPDSSPYSSYASGTAGESGDPYQQSPFGAAGAGGQQSEYRPPTY